MALGSSAPEILLSVIELASGEFLSGDLGPSTIVGSAAFNLLIITAVCVCAIPDEEVRKINDLGVYAVTATFSIFAYVWLFFIVQVLTPDEITIFEGVLTFVFFPVLVILAFCADKGYFSMMNIYDEEHHNAPRCKRSHAMQYLATSRDTDGWGCDGRFQPGGCRSGITGYFQTRGVDRYRCDVCDYDLCRKCVESHRRMSHHIIGSDVSKEELAQIELRILQQHGDALSDEQLVRLIQKEHAEPKTRAAYRVEAVRNMVGGKRLGVHVDDNVQYSLTSIVPIDGQTNADDTAKRPVMCPTGHMMHTFLTHKANFNCDICQKRFPSGTLLFGCRSCNFDACGDCKDRFVKADVTIQFCAANYSVIESIGTLKTHVQRSGDISQKVCVDYRTRDGSAVSVEDFVPIEGRLLFDIGEVQKVLPVQIVDDTSYEEDEEFYIDLFNPSCSSTCCKVVVGENKTATISIVDDDMPGVISFAEEDYAVTEGIENKVVTCTVLRKDGINGKVSCKYKTEDGSAIAGSDYLSVAGTLCFESGQRSKSIDITILSAHRYDGSEEFRLILSDIEGGAKFDESTDGGAESCVCTIVIESDKAAKGRVDRVLEVLMMDWDKAQIGHTNWKDQFIHAMLVNGGEDGEASYQDWIMHVITVFWKVLFACIPPTDFCDGWLCFICALIMIGVVTAFIGELASLLGCCLEIPDKITAITFVALGTSLPDTFASKTAAEQDPYADASIGNVTGSNSVNVFLGLGLPWVMGSIYWKAVGKTDLWRDEYRSKLPDFMEGEDGIFVVIGGDLGFSVGIFSACAMFAIGGLLIRRKMYGGELGGPRKPQLYSAVGLVGLWIFYIGISSWMILKNKDDCGR